MFWVVFSDGSTHHPCPLIILNPAPQAWMHLLNLSGREAKGCYLWMWASVSKKNGTKSSGRMANTMIWKGNWTSKPLLPEIELLHINFVVYHPFSSLSFPKGARYVPTSPLLMHAIVLARLLARCLHMELGFPQLVRFCYPCSIVFVQMSKA